MAKSATKKAPKPAKSPKPKAVKADNPKAAAGDNSAALSEDQQIALFFNHKGKYERALALKKKSDADLKAVCKMIKAEGTELEDIKTAITLDEEKGEKKVRAQIEDKIRVARWVGASVGYQVDMFEDRRPAVDKAFDDGKIVGLKGGKNNCPFDNSVPQYKRWHDGWSEGQAALTKKLAPKAPPAPAPVPPSPTPPAGAPTPH